MAILRERWRGAVLALPAGMYANAEKMPMLAQLHAALESLEMTKGLFREIRQIETFRSQRAELRGAADLVARAGELVRVLLDAERAR